MEQENKKTLFKELDKLSSEANSLNKELNKINWDKESLFRNKDRASKNIREKIRSIRENKSKRDSLTKKVKELKDKRNISNEKIKGKISEFKKLNDAKQILASKTKIKDHSKVRGEIDKIEVKLETEAMPFEAEKKLSKKLKSLKKNLDEASELISTMDKIKKLNFEINSSRITTNKVHNEIQKTAKESQKSHEIILKNSKEVDQLKIKEEELSKNFVNFKKKFNEINNKLKIKLNEIASIREKINKFQLEESEKRKLKETILVKSKEHEFEEKIKTGKKLTTDDFLAFQDIIKGKKEL